MKDSTGKRQLIGSLTKGLMILEMMMESDNLGVTEISRVLKVNKSSAYRLLITLEERGFVKQEVSGRYSLGMKLASFRTKVLEGIDIRDISRPFLSKITEKTRESSCVSILSKDQAIIIEKQSSKENISANLYIGLSEPLHCTAVGKILLSYLPENEQISLLTASPLERFTLKTITDVGILLEELKQIRSRGIAIDDEEYSLSMRCIAAPIFNNKGEVVAALGISGPITRIRLDILDDYIQTVKEVASELSSQMGYSGIGSMSKH
jgi:DNA-binding IclR family transcriptional regulator